MSGAFAALKLQKKKKILILLQEYIAKFMCTMHLKMQCLVDHGIVRFDQGGKVPEHVWVHLHIIPPFFTQGKTYFTSCVLPWMTKPFEKVVYHEFSKRQSGLQQTTFINIFSLFFRENKT